MEIPDDLVLEDLERELQLIKDSYIRMDNTDAIEAIEEVQEKLQRMIHHLRTLPNNSSSRFALYKMREIDEEIFGNEIAEELAGWECADETKD